MDREFPRRRADDPELAAQGGGTFAHANEPVTVARDGAAFLHPVVRHFQRQDAVIHGGADADGRGTRVPKHLRQ